MKDERTIKQLEGRTPNKVIIVPGIINLVGWRNLKTHCNASLLYIKIQISFLVEFGFFLCLF
jgi:hypothetical protein